MAQLLDDFELKLQNSLMAWKVPICLIELSAAALAWALVWGPGPAYGQKAPSPQPGSASEGRKIFLTRCFVCHGVNGNGKGPSAAGLGADPRDFTDPNWQKGVTDSQIETVIRYGGQAIGQSSAMPANSDLSESQVASLLQFIRNLGQR